MLFYLLVRGKEELFSSYILAASHPPRVKKGRNKPTTGLVPQQVFFFWSHFLLPVPARTLNSLVHPTAPWWCRHLSTHGTNRHQNIRCGTPVPVTVWCPSVLPAPTSQLLLHPCPAVLGSVKGLGQISGRESVNWAVGHPTLPYVTIAHHKQTPASQWTQAWLGVSKRRELSVLPTAPKSYSETTSTGSIVPWCLLIPKSPFWKLAVTWNTRGLCWAGQVCHLVASPASPGGGRLQRVRNEQPWHRSKAPKKDKVTFLPYFIIMPG